MKFITAGFAFLSIISSTVLADTSVTLSDVHLCCVTCQKAVESAVGEVKGAKVKVDRDKKTVAITASDETVAQKAVDAFAKAGFYGKSDNDNIAIKTTAEEGESSSVQLVGFHNCCVGCEYAIKTAINKIEGVDSAIVKKRSCTVKGSFDVAAVLKAVNNAGFSASVKK